MSYLDEIKRRGRDANPFLTSIGAEIGHYGKGKAELVLTVRPDMHNGVGWLQGGLYVALCDEAMALALFTALDEGTGIATISESTSFLEGVRSGRITARAEVVKIGRRVAFAEGRAFSEGNSVLTETHASFAIIPKKQ
jgi:uncharacterized protein (TIGR00369 family)